MPHSSLTTLGPGEEAAVCSGRSLFPMVHASQARMAMLGTRHGHGMVARAGGQHTDWTKRAASLARTRMLAHLAGDTNLNRASWQIQQKPPFRHFQKLCPHTSEGRLRTQGHSCAASYRAVNNTALQARARTAQDNGVASTRDKNYSKHLVTVLLCEAAKHILIQRV